MRHDESRLDKLGRDGTSLAAQVRRGEGVGLESVRQGEEVKRRRGDGEFRKEESRGEGGWQRGGGRAAGFRGRSNEVRLEARDVASNELPLKKVDFGLLFAAAERLPFPPGIYSPQRPLGPDDEDPVLEALDDLLISADEVVDLGPEASLESDRG